jgi:hypothetical protein
MKKEVIDLSPYDGPLVYAQTILERAGRIYGVEFKDLHSIEIENALLHHYTDVEFISDSAENQDSKSIGGYYVVSDRSALEIAILAQNNHSVAMMANKIVTWNLYADKPVPRPLLKVAIRRMSYGLVPNAFPPPKKGFPKIFVLRVYAHLVAVGVAELYQLPLTRNDGSPEHSACDVVSEAAKNLGVDIPYTRLRDWCSHKDNKAFREVSDIYFSIVNTGRFAVVDGVDVDDAVVRGTYD